MSGNQASEKNAVKVNMALQFNKIGAAVFLFAAINAILYTDKWTDGNLIPAGGNVIHTEIIKEMKKRGAAGKTNVAQAAMAGNKLAQQTVITHPTQFGLSSRNARL